MKLLNIHLESSISVVNNSGWVRNKSHKIRVLIVRQIMERAITVFTNVLDNIKGL